MKPAFPRIARACAATGVALAAGLLSGCAVTPAGVNSNSTRQLIVTMQVAGVINPSDFYYVVFNTSNDASGAAGPDPPIAANWGGNGFVTGSATQYMEYNASIPNSGYELGEFNQLSTGNLQALAPSLPPVSYQPVVSGTSNTLEFRIPLSYLATSTIPTASINYIQINFINTNQNANTTLNQLSTPKDFDALGNTLSKATLNEFITIPTNQDGTYSNSTITGASNESAGDVATTYGNDAITAATDSDATNLDIVNWSVQVTS